MRHCEGVSARMMRAKRLVLAPGGEVQVVFMAGGLSFVSCAWKVVSVESVDLGPLREETWPG